VLDEKVLFGTAVKLCMHLDPLVKHPPWKEIRHLPTASLQEQEYPRNSEVCFSKQPCVNEHPFLPVFLDKSGPIHLTFNVHRRAKLAGTKTPHRFRLVLTCLLDAMLLDGKIYVRDHRLFPDVGADIYVVKKYRKISEYLSA